MDEAAQLIKTARMIRLSVCHPMAIGTKHSHVYGRIDLFLTYIGREWSQVMHLNESVAVPSVSVMK